MRRTLAFLGVCLLAVACSARSNNFGNPTDAGGGDADTSPDVPDAKPDASPRQQIGEPCDGPDSCVEEALCIGTAEGEFVCMAKCTVNYDLCMDGSVCLPVMTQDASICYLGGGFAEKEACNSNLDCAPGLLCFGTSGQFFCRQACDEGLGACASDDYCLRLSTGAGLCRDTVGAPCPGAPCATGLGCSLDDPDISSLFPGGYCTKDCGSDADCPGDSVCRKFPSVAKSICVGSCSHPSDCRFNAGYDCYDATSCSDSADPTACETFFGGHRLCLTAAP